MNNFLIFIDSFAKQGTCSFYAIEILLKNQHPSSLVAMNSHKRADYSSKIAGLTQLLFDLYFLSHFEINFLF